MQLIMTEAIDCNCCISRGFLLKLNLLVFYNIRQNTAEQFLCNGVKNSKLPYIAFLLLRTEIYTTNVTS